MGMILDPRGPQPLGHGPVLVCGLLGTRPELHPLHGPPPQKEVSSALLPPPSPCPTPVRGKNSPWCQKVWGLLLEPVELPGHGDV